MAVVLPNSQSDEVVLPKGAHPSGAEGQRGLEAAAARLPIAAPANLALFQEQVQGLSEELTQRLLGVPDLEERLIGVGNRAMMEDNHRNHFRFLSAYLANPNPDDLVSTARWAIRTYMAHGFRPEYWRVMLPAALELLGKRLPQDVAKDIAPYYSFLADNLESLLPAPEERPEAALGLAGNLPPLAARYLELLLEGDRRQAANLILGQAAGGMPVRDIYLNVFSPAQRMLGQLWQENRISVAMEHFATAATQMVMSQLFPYIFVQGADRARLDAGFVGCCVQGELHEIGMRMVCDLLEIEGFDTWYLGANTPDKAVLDFLAEKRGAVVARERPIILGVSCTIAQGVPFVERLIGALRSDQRLLDVKVLVGGLPFVRRADLWTKVGADAHAKDAAEAAQVVRRLAGLTEVWE